MRKRFLEGMSRAAATVSVVTTDGSAGRAGVTVSAMCSVSADSATPSLLVCVNKNSRSAEVIRSNASFCVNVLRDDQSYIADIFAGRSQMEGAKRFESGDWISMKSGAPAVKGALVSFDCTLKKDFLYGSHWVFVGELIDIDVSDFNSPLVYANRAYGRPVAIDQIDASRRAQSSASDKLVVGCLKNLGAFFLPALLTTFAARNPGFDIEIFESDHVELQTKLSSGKIDFSFTYDLNDDSGINRSVVAKMHPYVLLPAQHPLAKNASLTLADVEKESLVLLDLPQTRDRTLKWFNDAGLSPTIKHRTKSLEMLRGMVGNGLGYAVLVTKPANNMTYDGKALAVRKLDAPIDPVKVILAWSAERVQPFNAEAFLMFCKLYFSETFVIPPSEVEIS